MILPDVAQTTDIARQILMSTFTLSRLQADAILEMPLRRLAGLELKKILDENQRKRAAQSRAVKTVAA